MWLGPIHPGPCRDVNVRNREVRNEIAKIVAFWERLGVSGFRVDAAPFIIERRRPAAIPATATTAS
ncbi:alpha-amylase family glycosyl hydrolase [Dactylosporangium darangshiense]|uniref:Glycosyl hydrolase family 13 catalytic domain-containing protein n=1 Tax=Dactylosporangium darangshiense TaxID=579108 RepID=A0ABP8DLV8_9ACTN